MSIRVLGEAAAPICGDSFVGIVGITLSQQHHLLGEVGANVHCNRNSTASTPSIHRTVTSLHGDAIQPVVASLSGRQDVFLFAIFCFSLVDYLHRKVVFSKIRDGFGVPVPNVMKFADNRRDAGQQLSIETS